ncbi:MAG: PhoU domain-containing protein [Gemmatimonadales bacterium]
MSHYEERLERDLNAIKQCVRDIGYRIEDALKDATRAAVELDKRLANVTILRDNAVNRSTSELDQLCHAFVVRHVPSAGHLRFVSAVLRLNVALERVGDYAVTICRETLLMSDRPSQKLAGNIELLAEQSQLILNQSLKAFNEGDVALARRGMGMADQVGATFQKVFDDLIEAGSQGEHRIKDLFAALLILHSLRRVSAQADNICELTAFTVAGKIKGPKVYRVLFVDERNDSFSQVAEAYAAKAFPQTSRCDSAGWNPADSLNPALAEFLDGYGLKQGTARTPTRLRPFTRGHRHYHVIVSLQDDVRPHLKKVPFRTVLLEWDVGPMPDPTDKAAARAALESAYPKIVEEVRNLMEILGGPGAG